MLGCADVAREDEQATDSEAPERRDEVADTGSPEGRAAVAGEARVIGGERRPGDDARDHEVDALGEGEAALRVRGPERVQVRLVENPPRQIADRREHGPGGELLHVAAHEADRPEQSES